ncbi:hypothetical protein ACIBF1_44280 [Spirillospora sp. NPDC050679]
MKVDLSRLSHWFSQHLGRSRPSAAGPPAGTASTGSSASQAAAAATPAATPVSAPVQPDPSVIVCLQDLQQQLGALRDWADVSYRRMERHSGGAFSHSAFRNAVARPTLPRLELVRAFVRACGVDDTGVAAWEDAWRRVKQHTK